MSETATKGKATPGPWLVNTLNGRLPIVRRVQMANGEADTSTSTIRNRDGAHVCRLDFGYGSPTDEANARLIAASPELLEALRAVLACETHHDERGHAYVRVPARSVCDLAAQIHFLLARIDGDGQ